jgi:DNA-directed RNA polymerase subunit beta'
MADNIYDRINDYGSVKIQLASPNDIRSWSFGEVKKPETINYRTYRAEKDGLFCERIFGPERDWQCACGKYKGTKHKGIICDRCGVKVTHSRVRRKRMGHINLAAPVVHIWFLKAMPSRLGNLLGMKTTSLEKVIYFQDYVVIDPGDTPLKKMQLLTEEEFRVAREKYGASFRAGMGAEAIRELLGDMDLFIVAEELREELAKTGSKQKIKDLSKRLRIVEALRHSDNDPTWMIMEVIPVIPPDLRPLVLLESGNFATSDLNDLYRRIINRNNRLKKLVDLNAPEVIIQNEKRMLQQAVDALFDNGRCRRPVLGSSNRPLKSLTDMIKGKQGRFRENLLGKRVDYSARSVIVVGPELKHRPVRAAEEDRPRVVSAVHHSPLQGARPGRHDQERQADARAARPGDLGYPRRGDSPPSGAAEPGAHAAPHGHPGVRAGAGRGQRDQDFTRWFAAGLTRTSTVTRWPFTCRSRSRRRWRRTR